MKMMRLRQVILIMVLFLLPSSCYSGITGTVVDAETGLPIEGAVVLLEWTKTKGIGFTSTVSYKVVEVVTDKTGKFEVQGVYNPFVDAPDVTIYKKGYVAWNNHNIFPDNRKRQDYQWRNGVVFIMERFKDTYSYDDHYYFIISAARIESATKEKHVFIKAYDEWEREKAINERDLKQMRSNPK